MKEALADTGNSDIKSKRRANKPLMEKRRRARINDCLSQLKSLVLEAMEKDVGISLPQGAHLTKLEKADILEMTVRHLESLQNKEKRKCKYAEGYEQSMEEKYNSGYNACVREVISFLEKDDKLKQEDRARMTKHISSSFQTLAGDCRKRNLSQNAAHAQFSRESLVGSDNTNAESSPVDISSKLAKKAEVSMPLVMCGSEIYQMTPGSFATGQYAVLIATPMAVRGVPTFLTAPVTAVSVHCNNNGFIQSTLNTVQDDCTGLTTLGNNKVSEDGDICMKDVKIPSIQEKLCPVNRLDSLWRPWNFEQ